MGFFDNLVKKADNEFAIKTAENLDETTAFVDTGAYALNAMLSGSIYGGVPDTKVLALAGEPSTGKSFIALSVAANFLKQNEEGAVIYFESEGAVDDTIESKEMLESRGIDTERFYVMPVSTIQDFKTQGLKMLNEYLTVDEADRKPMLFILDSLTNLSSLKEMEDSAAGSDTRDMTFQQKAKGTFRTMTLKLNRAHVPLIVTAHVYDQMGVMYPTKIMSGGRGLQYAASIITFLSKAKAKDSQQELIGALITFNLFKSRFTKEGSKVTLLLNHSKGLDKYYGLLDIADIAGLIKKEGTKWLLPDGSKAFETTIYKNPEKYFTKDFLDKIDAASATIFKYGVKDEDNTETPGLVGGEED